MAKNGERFKGCWNRDPQVIRVKQGRGLIYLAPVFLITFRWFSTGICARRGRGSGRSFSTDLQARIANQSSSELGNQCFGGNGNETFPIAEWGPRETWEQLQRALSDDNADPGDAARVGGVVFLWIGPSSEFGPVLNLLARGARSGDALVVESCCPGVLTLWRGRVLYSNGFLHCPRGWNTGSLAGISASPKIAGGTNLFPRFFPRISRGEPYNIMLVFEKMKMPRCDGESTDMQNGRWMKGSTAQVSNDRLTLAGWVIWEIILPNYVGI